MNTTKTTEPRGAQKSCGRGVHAGVTPKQRTRMYELYRSGVTVQTISDRYHLTPQTVRYHLRKARGAQPDKGTCPYSPDCFACPLPDCMVSVAYKFNALPGDAHLLHVLGRDDDWA